MVKRFFNLNISKKHLFNVALISLLMTLASEAFNQTFPEKTSNSTSTAQFVNQVNNSSPITLSPDGKTLWVVNPDADSVTAINTETMQASKPIAVGKEPWSIAISPFGVVVANRWDGSLSLINNGERSDIPVGPELGGIALSPSGELAYVTVSSADEVAIVNLSTQEIVSRIAVGRLPWAIAVTNNGDANDGDETIVVTHRLARLKNDGKEGKNDGKEGWITLLKENKVVTEIAINPYDFGFSNTLESVTISGDEAIVTHLLNNPELPRTFTTTISGGISTFSLSKQQELKARRIHTNDSDFSTPVNFPRAIALTSYGKKAYVALAGTNAIMGINLSDPEKPKLLGFWAVGDNPRGIVLSPDNKIAYVMNYLSRDVSVLDLTDTVRYPEKARITTTPETLEADILRGKIIFNNANDPRISRLGWMSCASCHIDGGVDGASWMTPEGLRQTMPLWNLAGTEPLHISATRDELQDFEGDIEALMNGVGFASGPANRLLGKPNAHTSTDLDALAAFVLNGIRVPQALKVNEEQLAEGREVFVKAGCASCHSGKNWTISHLPASAGMLAPNGEEEVIEILHDVGTHNPETDILGKNGFDVPTLLGLHATAPYLHDGSAKTLTKVLENLEHVSQKLTQEEYEDLVAFLKSIDNETVFFSIP